MRSAGRARRRHPVQLLCGVSAGPLFASAFTAIGATRPGYDWQRLPVSSLAIGRHGWLQRTNFVVAGLLYSCAACGLWRSPARRVGPRAVPVLVAGAGVGLIGSGIFVTDPVGDVPPKASRVQSSPDPGSGTAVPTVGGRLHNLFAIPIFAGVPLAGLASATAALRLGDDGWAAYSVASSLATVVAFALFGSAFSDGSPRAGKGGVFQRISIAAGFGWMTAVSLRALPFRVGNVCG